MRRAKKELLQLKKEKEKRKKASIDIHRRVVTANQKTDKNSLASHIEGSVGPDGRIITKLKDGNPLEKEGTHPELKTLITSIVNGDTAKHYKYCPCCRTYDNNDDLTPE